jgi:hypothetical protein
MGSPSIAHFGTTVMEPPPPPGVSQQEAPQQGPLGRTLEFFRLMGLRPLLENMYEGIGRQYIWSRGGPQDADYLEIDTFTSYRAVPRPESAQPRIGDTVFRLTHPEPRELFAAWTAQGLATTMLPQDRVAAFQAGESDWLLLRGPQGQLFELGPTQRARADNHVVYIWSDPRQAAQTAANYCREFSLEPAGEVEFHGQAKAMRLRRERPGVTVCLLTPLSGGHVAARWSEDIFVEAGYSHFRLGSFDKSRTRRASREAFPDGGDVSFVYFEDSYLELVQVHDDDPAMTT